MNSKVTEGSPFNYKYTYSVVPSVKGDKIYLEEFHESFNNLRKDHYQLVLDLKEKAVREALIALGWTPPPDGSNVE